MAGEVDSAAEHVARAVTELRAGGLVLVPTDTVYGVAVLAEWPGAVDRLAEAKGRSPDQAVAVLVATFAQAETLIDFAALGPAQAAARRLVERMWPGPATLVLPRTRWAAELDLGGDGSKIGVRLPDHRLLRRLAAAAGPLATTSANRHGQPTPSTALSAMKALCVVPNMVVDGGTCNATASAVLDLTTSPYRVLRAGPFHDTEIATILAGS